MKNNDDNTPFLGIHKYLVFPPSHVRIIEPNRLARPKEIKSRLLMTSSEKFFLSKTPIKAPTTCSFNASFPTITQSIDRVDRLIETNSRDQPHRAPKGESRKERKESAGRERIIEVPPIIFHSDLSRWNVATATRPT
jgi:hypothetical protein